jgi:hypothetical protein
MFILMLIQIILLLILSTIVGLVVLIAKLTDPNSTPSPSREQIYPFGFALLFAGVYGIGALFGLFYIGRILPFDGWLAGLMMWAFYGLSILAVALLGYKIGGRKR